LGSAELTSLFSSTTHASGRRVMPSDLHLKAAFGELKLDLRQALLPYDHVRLVCESLCASVQVLLPDGVAVTDDRTALLSSHKLAQAPHAGQPVIHLEGWSVCSDVKVLAAGEPEVPVSWS
jgi:predicted membrane protein